MVEMKNQTEINQDRVSLPFRQLLTYQ